MLTRGMTLRAVHAAAVDAPGEPGWMAPFLASLARDDLAPATLRGYRYDLRHWIIRRFDGDLHRGLPDRDVEPDRVVAEVHLVTPAVAATNDRETHRRSPERHAATSHASLSAGAGARRRRPHWRTATWPGHRAPSLARCTRRRTRRGRAAPSRRRCRPASAAPGAP